MDSTGALAGVRLQGRCRRAWTNVWIGKMRVIYDHIVDNGVSITDVVASLFIYLTRWYEI